MIGTRKRGSKMRPPAEEDSFRNEQSIIGSDVVEALRDGNNKVKNQFNCYPNFISDCNVDISIVDNNNKKSTNGIINNTDMQNVNRTSNNKRTNRNGTFAGDTIVENKGDRLRIFYNNCNSLEINDLIRSKMKLKKAKNGKKILGNVRQNTKAERLMDTLESWQVDIACLAETCVAWEFTTTRNIFKALMRQYDRSGCWAFSSSTTASSSFFKPGGTAISINGNWSGRVIDRGWDPKKMGRWSYVTLNGKESKALTIITGYRVPQLKAKYVGDKTAIMQQEILLHADNRKEVGARTAFFQDLKAWIKPRILQGQDILLCLDANEEWTENSAIKNFSDQLGLINIGLEKFKRLPHSKPASNKTIDFMLGTEEVVRNTIAYGLTPYNLRTLGDHRGQYVDINIKGMLGISKMDTYMAPRRRLNTKDINATKKYLEKLTKSIVYHNVEERMRNIITGLSNAKNEIDVMRSAREYDKVAEDMHRLCRNAEKGCKKLGKSDKPWFPDQQLTIDRIFYLHRNKHINKNKKIIGPTHHKQCEELDLKINITKEEDIKMELDRQYKIKEENDEKPLEHRAQFLTELSKTYASDNKMTEAQAVRELLSHEDLRNTHAQIAEKMKEQRSGSLHRIWVAKDNSVSQQDRYKENNKLEINDGSKLGKHILHRNKAHLRQASNTPFADSDLGKELGVDGDSDITDSMLEGKWDPKGDTKKWIIEYLDSLKTTDPKVRDKVNGHIEDKEYRQFWTRKRETTTTSPFGLHIGHYKAGLQNETICNIQRYLMILPFQYGFIPQRWKKTVQLMLEKDTGKPWLHRLRIIELFDAQLNAALQILVGKK